MAWLKLGCMPCVAPYEMGESCVERRHISYLFLVLILKCQEVFRADGKVQNCAEGTSRPLCCPLEEQLVSARLAQTA